MSGLQHYKKKAGRISNFRKLINEEYQKRIDSGEVNPFRTFEELLEEGVRRLEEARGKNTEQLSEDNITGLEESLTKGKYLDIMIDLNHYVYTVYSTYHPEIEPLGIEFVLPLWMAKELALRIEDKYWYLIRNDHGDILDCLVDKDKALNEKIVYQFKGSKYIGFNKDLELAFKGIDYYYADCDEFYELAKQRGFYHRDISSSDYRDPQYPNYKGNMCNNRVLKAFVIAGYFKNYKTCDDSPEEFSPGYAVSIETKYYTLPELYDKKLQKDNVLVSMLVEDPIIERKTLYYKLFEIIKDIAENF